MALALYFLLSPLKVLALSTMFFPFHSINAGKTLQYNTVVNTNTLTVVAVESPTTVFKEDQFLHGFGYDLARNYAQSLNVKLDFKIVTDNATALKWVQQGKANLAMTTA
ncbi:TPA: transporter substrate-binding domain-containing protein, partial [Escherichia coli]|nr:transporter substrate-binding domain-containing protein [Escherichia coli]